MEKEFGINQKGNIDCLCTFIADMKKLCGKYATVAGINGIRIYLNIDGIGWTNWVYTEDMIKPAEFTKADLEIGMILETRNGNRYIYLGDFATSIDDFVYMSLYDEDLMHKANKGYDVVKILKPNTWDSLRYVLNSGNLVWERKPKVKELTTEEAIDLLKAKFDEFDEIRIK